MLKINFVNAQGNPVLCEVRQFLCDGVEGFIDLRSSFTSARDLGFAGL